MNKTKEQIKQHIQALEPQAQLRLLVPSQTNTKEDWRLYVLTDGKIDLTKEKQLLDACYKIELETGQSVSMFVYSRKDWHKQLKNTPIYQQVMKNAEVL
ncbi:hypothetical protein [Saccharicrinis sp. GN24d3]|uniref:hypothetical protein n=1 Tax=Saccharicrinis sp. GN24d3 TaxID=3458416 RepID=UPI0040358B73